jgi:hypothetical protein
MRLTSITLRPGAATARLVPSLSFHPTSTVSSARAPQACCILQPTMGFTAFPPSAHSIHLGFQIELLRPFTSIHLRAPGLPHSVRFEIPISNHPPKVFPPPQPYPVSFLKIEEGCKQRFFEVCSPRTRLCFRSGHFSVRAPLRPQDLPPSSLATEVAALWAVPSRRCSSAWNSPRAASLMSFRSGYAASALRTIASSLDLRVLIRDGIRNGRARCRVRPPDPSMGFHSSRRRCRSQGTLSSSTLLACRSNPGGGASLSSIPRRVPGPDPEGAARAFAWGTGPISLRSPR